MPLTICKINLVPTLSIDWAIDNIEPTNAQSVKFAIIDTKSYTLVIPLSNQDNSKVL